MNVHSERDNINCVLSRNIVKIIITTAGVAATITDTSILWFGSRAEAVGCATITSIFIGQFEAKLLLKLIMTITTY